MKILILLVFIFSCFSSYIKAQVNTLEVEQYFVSTNLGVQMSGIKYEDFVINNYSPMFKVSLGKWFTSILALEIGYRGVYFNTIENSDRRYYNYYFGNTIFNLTNIVNGSCDNGFEWLGKVGSGLFYNRYYGQPNIVASFGVSVMYKINKEFRLSFEASSLMGWDLYQGDADIIPSLSSGFSYVF